MVSRERYHTWQSELHIEKNTAVSLDRKQMIGRLMRWSWIGLSVFQEGNLSYKNTLVSA